jgi:hypothetical protein
MISNLAEESLPGNGQMSELGQIRKSGRATRQSALPSILLQNSFWITERKFSGPLVRRSNVYVRDHVIERRTHG